MPKITNIEVQPYYAQVALFDPHVEDSYPDWGTGEEEVVSSGRGIAVETRPDHKGSRHRGGMERNGRSSRVVETADRCHD